MTKRLKIIAVLAALLVYSGARGDDSHDLCRQDAIGTVLTLTLQGGTQIGQTQFKIAQCENNIYTAREVTTDSQKEPLYLQFPAGNSAQVEVGFVKKLSGDNLNPEFKARWDRSTGLAQVEMAEAKDSKQCDPGFHWDETIEECVIDGPAAPPETPRNAVTQECKPNEHWYPPHNMCMPNEIGKTNFDFMMQQYIVWNQGVRMNGAPSGQNMAMTDLNHYIASNFVIGFHTMLSTDYWLVSHSTGIPQPLQIGEGFWNAQHPHSSPIAGLTGYFKWIFKTDESRALVIEGGPRGEGASGPPFEYHRFPYLPDVDLDHHLTTSTHISSTPIIAKLIWDGWTLEISGTSGVTPQPLKINLDMHAIDTVEIHVTRDLKNWSVGSSYAHIKDQDPDLTVTWQKLFEAWVQFHKGFRWGRVEANTIGSIEVENPVGNPAGDVTLSSFTQEMMYRFPVESRFKKYDTGFRLEMLTRTWDQLLSGSQAPGSLIITDRYGAHYIKAVTFFVEREIKPYASIGVAVTHDDTGVFSPLYPKGANTVKFYLRLHPSFSKSWNKSSGRNQ